MEKLPVVRNSAKANPPIMRPAPTTPTANPIPKPMADPLTAGLPAKDDLTPPWLCSSSEPQFGVF